MDWLSFSADFSFTHFSSPAIRRLTSFNSLFCSLLGHNALALHLGSGYAHVYGRYLFYALSLVGTVVYPLRDILLRKVLVRNVCPCPPPHFGFAFVIPVCEVNFSRFETAVFQLYPLTVFV